MANVKKFKPTSIVLEALIKKQKSEKKINVTANSFSSINWKGVKIVSGEKYYVDKAIKAGAEMAK